MNRLRQNVTLKFLENFILKHFKRKIGHGTHKKNTKLNLLPITTNPRIQSTGKNAHIFLLIIQNNKKKHKLSFNSCTTLDTDPYCIYRIQICRIDAFFVAQRRSMEE